jgi:NAD(P)-dependent dehydrogenase (short-subunit alcohol dehydrogenase family)
LTACRLSGIIGAPKPTTSILRPRLEQGMSANDALGLSGKTALITGGSKGIGKAIATSLANAGANVMICARKAEDLQAAASEIGNGAQWCVANAGKAEDAEAAVATTLEHFGALDILVNNAATNPYAGPTIDIDLPRWEKTWQVNLTGPLLFSQLAWHRYMKDGPEGSSIINISSIGGYHTNPILGAYDTTKAALIHMTKQLAAELGPKARVNAICPGLVRTKFASALWEGPGEEMVAKRNPTKRIGEPNDIAGTALYLASDLSSWVTGEAILVDGGQHVAF